MAFTFTGVDALYKVPRFMATLQFAAGAVSAGSLPMYCLHIGMKTSAGSMTEDQDIVEVTSADDVNAYAGARSELAQMARAGIKAAPTVRHFMAAVAEPSGGTYAQCTLVIAGSWSTDGEIAITFAGKRFSLGVSATDTIDVVGAALAARLSADTEIPATFTYNTSTDTLTGVIANKGATGTSWVIGIDKSKAPSGMTLTLSGSASLSGDRVKFGVAGSGTGTADVTTLLTKLLTGRYARIAVSTNDATNAALLETHVNTKAGATKLLLEQLIFASNASQSTATTLAQTTLNAPRAMVAWMRNANIHPAVIASTIAAIRAQTEPIDWVPDYDGKVLPFIPPQHISDVHTDAENNTALQNGVTPIATGNNEASIVRCITSYCLNGSAQDERCLDIGDVVVTDNGTLDLKLLYETDFRPGNPRVQADPADGEPLPPSGVGYPRLWNALAMKRAREWFANGFVRNPDATPFISQFNSVSQRIETQATIVPQRVQHQIAVAMRQQGPA